MRSNIVIKVVFLGSMAMVAFFFGKQFLDWYWRLL